MSRPAVLVLLACAAGSRLLAQPLPAVPLVAAHPEYWELHRAWQAYGAIAARGGWPALPDDLWLERDPRDRDGEDAAGDSAGPEHPALETLCQRLLLTGDYGRHLLAPSCAAYGAPGASYDAPLEAAVRRFQQRHGLAVDGIVGPRTVAAMNVPARARVAQLARNRDRWFGLPDLGRRYVRVNIAGFFLEAVQDGQEPLWMRVVVGRPSTPTPRMADRISYLVFRPYWNVPRSITERELLPTIAADRSYLHRRQLEIVDGWGLQSSIVAPEAVRWDALVPGQFPYRLRQRPGPHNSLGLVKFMFPNDEHVYLHDTPARHLFDAPRRAFSHGCVRVEDPVSLAAFLLQDDPGWSRARIEEAMHRGGRQIVPLPAEVPVYLTYFTAWVDDDRTVQFRADTYGWDGDR